MSADEIPLAIQWHEGMLLAPQHFQRSAQRQEMLTQYSALLVGPYSWGVRKLLLDGKLLPSGVVRVLELEAVLPDGSIALHRPEGGHELMVQLNGASFPRNTEIAIYLALPARSAAGIDGAMARYESIESGAVADENTGEDALRIPLLRPRLSLMAGEQPPPKYVSITVAKVRFEDEACAQTNYIPPATSVPARSALGELCGELASRVREKALFIAEQVASPSAVLDKPMTMENLGKMQSLISCLPAFEALLLTDTSHPLTLYLAVCSMVGSMAGLGAGILPPVFAPYNHSDLRSSFEEVIGFAMRMTSEGIPESYGAHPFDLKNRIFSLLFSGEWAARSLVLALRQPAGASEKDMIQWGEECLIGSESVIASAKDRRIRGAWRQHVEKYQDLVPVRGVVLFTLRPDPEFLKPGESLQILNTREKNSAISPLEIVLYVKRPA